VAKPASFATVIRRTSQNGLRNESEFRQSGTAPTGQAKVSVRPANCLREADITTLGELVAWSEDQLLKRPKWVENQSGLEMYAIGG